MNKNTPRSLKKLKRYSNYHFCIVKECKNTSVNSPHKLWIQLPRERKKRETWLKLVGRDQEYLSPKTLYYFCDDHFDMENDMANYLEYKLMGSIKQIRMKPKAVPSRSKFRRPDHPHKNIERNEILENTNYCIAASLYIRPRAKLMTDTEDYKTNTKHIPKKCNTFSCICGETFSCVTSMDKHRKLYKHYMVYSGMKDVTKATPAVKLKKNRKKIDRGKAIHPSKNIIYPCDIREKTQDDSRRENEYLTEAVPVRNSKEKNEIAACEFILSDVFIKQEIIDEISNNKAEDDEIAASQKDKDKIAASELIIPNVFIKQEIIEEISNKKAEDDEIAGSQLTIPPVFIEQEKEESSIKEEKDDEKVASELAIPSVYINQEIIEECLIKKEKDDEILTSELIIPPEVIKQESKDKYTQPKRKKIYKKYDEDVIEEALKEYKENKNSFKVIADKHNIPKTVLHRHYTRYTKKQGGQTALSQETEKYITKYLNICSEWGYPLDAYDVRLLVKDYLDRIGITVKKFRDNMPGPNYLTGFLSRNQQDISLRLSENFNRVRAAVSPEIINQYFDELGLSLDGVPLCNLVNYDETNLSEDPGRRKIICKRGAKYPERMMNHGKGYISLMLAAAADGTLLPPYVVYKSQHLYDTWTTGGPEGCRYNRTVSGWFDRHTFEEWVRTVIYSYFKDKTGKKLLIGDHLSSHLSIDLIRECKERDIHFAFLPSYSSHLTQPLDVAFFRPMQIAWRDILFHWKKTDGRVQATLPKALFPQLLKKILQRLDVNAKQNILSGFSKAGISPLNRRIVLDGLPNNYEREDSIFSIENVDETVSI
ncbi:uncharacterized protein LOC121737649 isoform X2 [Aricia agestis]|uniref:uncharacterized protein LOC121737649 isoform X2 n=1 Tax=Aricia agestis TaxID=91739 RepID=UPI001C204855|nr:uncharacterized protein LOC121737649 isoform X2 [Aricia agestis]